MLLMFAGFPSCSCSSSCCCCCLCFICGCGCGGCGGCGCVVVVVVVVVVVGANAARRAAIFPCNCCVLLFEHFTRCRCLACMSHMLASAQGGYNVPDEFKTAGHRGPWVHVTCCCCWHVAHARSLMQQGVGGGVITLLTTLTYFNTVGQNGSSVSNINNILCRSWPNSSKQRTAAEERQRRAEEHMRALRAKANVDTSQSFVLICFEYWPDRDDHKNYIVKVKDT